MTMKINDNGTERDMTEAEQAEHEAWQKEVKANQKAKEKAEADKAKAKAEVIAKLGLTADEVAALLS